MQIIKTFMILAACTATALSVAVPNDAAADGSSNQDAALSARVHPLGHERYLEEASLAPFDDTSKENSSQHEARGALGARAADKCYNGAPYGCSKGYCWKTCGQHGEWCWTAYGDGRGSWITCNTYSDCGGTSHTCGIGKDGGCSC